MKHSSHYPQPLTMHDSLCIAEPPGPDPNPDVLLSFELEEDPFRVSTKISTGLVLMQGSTLMLEISDDGNRGKSIIISIVI